MSDRGNLLSRNPNVCASCSSMIDGMGNSDPGKELTATTEPEPRKTQPDPKSRPLVISQIAGAEVALRLGR